ncbi:TPA: hypothetical protein ACRNUD_005748 [Pseudomonas aeruginosa]|uniref:hypothetical protein n=1 Tax=Pseudomonas TaxID=286 RepID=UPI000281C055|nr:MULTISPECIES: hypothetical protein [Pseudomonas]EKA41671.1 hypothetical protein PACI27_4156 [Pseudomonas aeruginosa CI27]ELK4912268.1 hypothetical protein [Pseudomonas aeruginosa]KAA8772828.1 hypothetical protein F3155_30890 [Pseudomonas aeruginosa]MBA4938720.1 hypothetical protein [Pseudomonas aeruginosa]MBV5576275.1 hypothetical protein [Pseudomonas aeruginosa]
MNLNSARIAWHDAFYTPWNSGMAEAAERAALGIVEAGGYVRRRITEIDDDGEAVSYSQHAFVPGIHQTRTERDISTPRAVHQALAGVIQKAIDTLPAHLKVFGNHMYSPMAGEDDKEAAEEIVFRVAYETGPRMYTKKFEKARYVAAGVLFRYRRMHQGGQSEGVDPCPSPESFRAWLLQIHGLELSSEQWTREWEGFIQSCFDACNDLDKAALVPVSSAIKMMKNAA